MENKNGVNIIALRYENAKAAIDWLVKAFGYKEHLVVPGKGNKIEHAQLTFGNGMIMLSSPRDTLYGKFVKSPAEMGGFITQSPYIIVEDIDSHYLNAKNCGAEMIVDLKEEDYGGKTYTCKDPEGHIWTFGSYDPWNEIEQ